MAKKRKIIGDIADRVIELSATCTYAQISRILVDEFKISISGEAIRLFLKEIRQERAEQTKALVQEKIKATVPRDLDILDELITQELSWFKSDEIDIGGKLTVAKELRQTIDTKLKYSGAGINENEVTLKLYDFDTDVYPEPEN